jgi:hypothetical protein
VVELPLTRFDRDDELVAALEPRLARGLAAREEAR